MNDVSWTDICTVKYSAVTLATRYLSPPPTGQKTDVQPWYQNWDYARTTYYEALTTTDNTLRSNAFEYTFLTLGHVLHLLQDMGVPAHTRNDFASHRISVNGGPKRQPYEHYVRENPTLVTEMTVTPSFANKRLTDFWDAEKYNGSNPSTLTDIGLAEFSNANYLSDYTIPNNGTTPQHTFPYPHIGSANISGPNYQICSYQFMGGVASSIYVSRTYKGPCPATPGAADHFAVASLMNLPGVSDINSISHVWLSPEVHDQYAQELLPRAVGYSAALLDYFFRGTLDVSWPETVVYSIADGSQTPYTDVNGNPHQQFTKIKASVVNTTPNGEAIGAGELRAVAKYKIIPNYAADLSNYPPSSSLMRDVPYSYSVSLPTPVAAIPGNYTDFTFDFSNAPIPAGITDLTLQVVFKGTIGNEADNAIAVGMKDLMEPTHLTIWNLTDMFPLLYSAQTYTLYTFDQIKDLASPGSGLLATLDRTQDGTLDDEPYLKPFTSTYTVSYWTGLSWNSLASAVIPAGNHIRIITLTDQAAINLKLQWEDAVSPGDIIMQIPGVVNQADPNGAYPPPTTVYTFRKGYGFDGQTLVPSRQHQFYGTVECLDEDIDSLGYCPYPYNTALPVSLTPLPFTLIFD